MFAFNQVIPLDIVSFYSFSHLITMHPKVGNPFAMHSLKEENELRGILMHYVASKMSEGLMYRMREVRITSAHESVRIFSFP